ncbi:L-histidine N(alpha)-methyltransferase [Eilatimonas milleporae]|uniref:Dimethylhistidine N-methyltransferase n=1 Tax=Eilatimonas milleporae TaxID=911205 RepID=A0A3M0CKX7_9PROT|nr:L-histidine N(alpha)-methyltransferase [Eilatimonas milleporae]RMB07719.1 dimethylhistidine N-methyltransferase [Eilatimonas milleporae]
MTLTDDFRQAVLDGLGQSRKAIPCRFLYDETGSGYFDDITRLDEYYPTRTERSILKTALPDMAVRIGPGASVLELGSGTSEKTGALLAALEDPRCYVPLDIDEATLEDAAGRLRQAFPHLPVVPLHADFNDVWTLPPQCLPPVLCFFPGSTIGNFDKPEAETFLRHIRSNLGPNARLLIGVDLVKDTHILEAAYDDAKGVTAAFNLNLLVRINRELCGDFKPEAFRHRAVYNEDRACIEMYLVSQTNQTVRIGGTLIQFAAGEMVHTEDSHKYTPEGFATLAGRAGWRRTGMWMDDGKLFSVQLFEAE